MPTSKADENKKTPAGAAPGPWSAFRHPVFRYLWIATVVSNIGTWMYNAA